MRYALALQECFPAVKEGFIDLYVYVCIEIHVYLEPTLLSLAQSMSNKANRKESVLPGERQIAFVFGQSS